MSAEFWVLGSGSRVLRATAVGILGISLALLPTGRLAAQAPQVRGAAVDRDGFVRIFSTAGSIKVTGWDRDSLEIRGRMAPGQQLFGGGSRRAIKFGADGPEGPSHLEVTMPRGVKLVIDAGESTVEVAGMTGAVEVRTGGGNIEIRDAPVRVTIETVDGDVTLSGGPFLSTEVRSAGGDIRVTGARAECTLTSVSGGITAEVVGVTRGRVSSVNGPLRFSGNVDPTGTLAIESHGGEVVVALDAGVGAEIVATNFGGEIVNTLTNARPRAVRGTGRLLQTELSRFGGTVTITAFRGRVTLQQR
jgi:hypothetical protein